MRILAAVAGGAALGGVLVHWLHRRPRARAGDAACDGDDEHDDDGAPAATAVPDAQLAPRVFETYGDDARLMKRLETVLARRTERVIVVLERLCDGHNYSAILRTCEAVSYTHLTLPTILLV